MPLYFIIIVEEDHDYITPEKERRLLVSLDPKKTKYANVMVNFH